MATRTALLNGNVINRDTDFSKHIEAVSSPWVISWFAVSSSSVAVWQALVKCERTNGDTIYAVVYNNSAQEISWNGDVFIEISQELIDNWELMNEDWSEIAEIKVGTMPSKNALKLATITSGVVEDERVFIKKVDDIRPLEVRMWVAETKIDQIIEDSATDHLEETWRIWEIYTLSDSLFKYISPLYINSTIDTNVWDTASNTKIHIQRISSGVASNKLKLKVKTVGSPTTWLTVEIRKWVVWWTTQYSEWYSYVAENWNSEYTRSKLMPYCLSDWLLWAFLWRYRKEALAIWSAAWRWIWGWGWSWKINWDAWTYRYDSSVYTWSLSVRVSVYISYTNQWRYVKKNWTKVYTHSGRESWWSYDLTFSQWDTITVWFNVDVSEASWSYWISVLSWTVGIPWSKWGSALKINEVWWLWELM